MAVGQFIVIIALVPLLIASPIKNFNNSGERAITHDHNIVKRFVDFAPDNSHRFLKMRTKRGAEDCEKLRLCRLHAHAGSSLTASFELYFVNKEAAQLWDHRRHTMAECHELYGDKCEGKSAGSAYPSHEGSQRSFLQEYSDYSPDYY